MPPRYAELRCRSSFSFLEGASQPEELVDRAADLGLEALALTKYRLWNHVRDHGLLDSAVHLYQALELYNRVVTFFDRAGSPSQRRCSSARPAKP